MEENRKNDQKIQDVFDYRLEVVFPEEWLDMVLEFDKLCRRREEIFTREGKVKPVRLG